MCLDKGHNMATHVGIAGSNSKPLDDEFDALPPGHHTPQSVLTLEKQSPEGNIPEAFLSLTA